jgi:hypothetical protein
MFKGFFTFVMFLSITLNKMLMEYCIVLNFNQDQESKKPNSRLCNFVQLYSYQPVMFINYVLCILLQC